MIRKICEPNGSSNQTCIKTNKIWQLNHWIDQDFYRVLLKLKCKLKCNSMWLKCAIWTDIEKSLRILLKVIIQLNQSMLMKLFCQFIIVKIWKCDFFLKTRSNAVFFKTLSNHKNRIYVSLQADLKKCYNLLYLRNEKIFFCFDENSTCILLCPQKHVLSIQITYTIENLIETDFKNSNTLRAKLIRIQSISLEFYLYTNKSTNLL